MPQRNLFKNLMLAGTLTLLSAPAFANDWNSNPGGSYDWSGPYAGIHIGGAWSEFKNSAGVRGPDGDDGSFVGGVHIGNNWQRNHFVLGVEGDISAMDLESKISNTRFEEDWMSTMRGRMGYSVDRFLPYLTAGLALTGTSAEVGGVGHDSEVHAGFTGGIGVDGMITDKWIGRVEYLHVDVPKDNSNISGATVRGGSDNDVIRVGLSYRFSSLY